MSGVWVVAFVVLAVSQVFTLVVVIGVVRQVIPLLEAGGAGDHGRGQQGGAVSVTPRVGPAVGSRLPDDLSAKTDDGRELTAGDLTQGGVVLLFLDAGCGPCQQIADGLRSTDLRLGDTRLYAVVDDDVDPARAPSSRGLEVLRQQRGAVATAVGVDATPAAVVVRDGVVVDARVVASVAHLQELVDLAAATRGAANG